MSATGCPERAFLGGEGVGYLISGAHKQLKSICAWVAIQLFCAEASYFSAKVFAVNFTPIAFIPDVLRNRG